MEVGHDLAQVKMVGACKCGNEPSRAMQRGSTPRGPVTFSRWTLLHVVNINVKVLSAFDQYSKKS